MENGSWADYNEEGVRDVALTIVDDVINKAKIVIKDRHGESSASCSFPAVPTIQIDVVASRTPSPTDSLTDETTGDTCLENSQVKSEDELQLESPVEPIETTESKDSEQLREFVFSYLQDIFCKALPIAEERAATKLETMKIEEGESSSRKKIPSPWYIRLRESLLRFLRLACICGGRRNNS
ncbi:uncharacterized protein LOC111626822 [Centruroides sculpturatus]|uniref:uncharacterized protein LOC111626822 n=1 Tax=Centruroides sculpturatus TaxID=218467 RepID=UPI000C6D3096|nr:uncharacterized protein LOC111626822 [Centruroides sculpturatus]